MATILIQRLDGTTYDLDELGYRVSAFDIPINNNELSWQQIGKYGSVLTDVQNQYNVLTLKLDITAHDKYDYELQLLKLRQIFRSDEAFFVINSRVPFLRWRAYAEAVTPSREGNFWRATGVELSLDVPDGYAETVRTSLDDSLDVPSDWWSNSVDLTRMAKPVYKFTNQTSINFFNIGSIPLNSDDKPVVITFKGVVDKELKITNKTTNQSIKITKKLDKSKELKITGFVPMWGDEEIYSSSDHGYLDFALGKNELTIEGATDFEVSFNTRFYF